MTEHVLVVGGAGYIGSICCQHLAREGLVPVTFDNLTTGWAENVRFGPLEVGDIRDREALASVFRRYRPRTVMHFAALASVPESVRDPLRYYDNNVAGALELVRAAVEHEVESFVFSSTAAVYGVPETMPIPLDAPLVPVNPYGATKAMVERILGDAAAASGRLAATCLRYFNACGADPEGELGERHEPETHLIPIALQAAADGGTMSLFGDDYPTPDGTCVRDYIHVTDLALAHLAALDHLRAGGGDLTLNCGYGRGFSVREVIEVVKRVSGVDFPVKLSPRRPGDPASLVAKADRIRAELGWMPKHDDLDTIVREALAWEDALAKRNTG